MNKIYLIAIGALAALFVTVRSHFSKSEEGSANEVKTERKLTKSEPVENGGAAADKTGAAAAGKAGAAASNKTEKTDGKNYEIPQLLTKNQGQIIEHVGHTLSYNKKYNTPYWSAWQLTKAKTDGPNERSKKFWADPAVDKPYRVDWYEYKESGYDRGHMCPAADMKWSEQAMHDCFYMTNMCPQVPALNSGAWRKLEEKCRQWAIEEGRIYIVCGPIYKKGVRHEEIGIDHRIMVPEQFFKAVLSLRKGKEWAAAFIYDNTDRSQSMRKAIRTVDEVEKIIGMDLFYQLDDALEERIESRLADVL